MTLLRHTASVLSGRIHQLHGDYVSCVRKASSEKEESELGLVLADDGLLGLYFNIHVDQNFDRLCLQEKKKTVGNMRDCLS